MSETADAIRLGLASRPLREPILRSAIQAMRPKPSRRGLDAGYGIGLSALPLAQAVGPTGHVTGLDLSPEFLAHARALAARARMVERVAFRQGDVSRIPFGPNAFDWTWSVDCVD